jgi:hypothetical protein
MSGSNAGRMALQTNPTLNIKSTSSMIQNLRGGAISGRIVYSVGFRRSFTDPWDSMQNIRHPIPFLAAPDPSFPNFPGGLEIKVVGTGNAERVVARLVVMSNHSVTTFDAQSAMVIAARGMS